MKCLSCQKPMFTVIEDFDYSSLAGLRGVTVTLCDVTIHRCERCGPTFSFIEIRRIGDLIRVLEAARAIHVKQLWCTFGDDRDDGWAIAFTPGGEPTRRRKRR